MNYHTFKSQYLGTRHDYDGVYGFQCVDLAKLWAEKGWGQKPKKVGYSGGAKEVMKHSDSMLTSEQAIRIPNTPSGVPPTGAIIVFNSAPKNVYGHIAVVDSADTKQVTVLEQNANGRGDGLGTGAIRLKSYSYAGNGKGVGKVLGWLIPIKRSPIGIQVSHLA